METTDEHFIDVALSEAEKSLALGVLPVGAALVVDGKLVGGSHKRDDDNYHLNHAETMLCDAYFPGKKIKRGEHDIVLYTTLEPCFRCLGTILHLPINRVVYAASDPYGGACCILAHPDILPYRHQKHPLEVRGGIHEELAKKQLRRFLAIVTDPFYLDPENPLVRYIRS